MEIQLWKEILSPYEQAVDELLVKFNHIIMQYKSMGKYSPIESVTGRVKTVSSIIDKLQKKNIPMDRIVEEMDDIAGIRIMCQFTEDISKVVEIIRGRQDMRIREEKDYIANAKASGYQSYHIILDYDVYTVNGCTTIQECGDSDSDDGDELLGNHRTFIAVQVQEGNSRGHKGEAQERCGCHRCT